jgi:hypothetical protein
MPQYQDAMPMVAVRVCRDDSCPEKCGESAFLDMRIKEAGLSVKEMLRRFPVRQTIER